MCYNYFIRAFINSCFQKCIARLTIITKASLTALGVELMHKYKVTNVLRCVTNE